MLPAARISKEARRLIYLSGWYAMNRAAKSRLHPSDGERGIVAAKRVSRLQCVLLLLLTRTSRLTQTWRKDIDRVCTRFKISLDNMGPMLL